MFGLEQQLYNRTLFSGDSGFTASTLPLVIPGSSWWLCVAPSRSPGQGGLPFSNIAAAEASALLWVPHPGPPQVIVCGEKRCSEGKQSYYSDRSPGALGAGLQS